MKAILFYSVKEGQVFRLGDFVFMKIRECYEKNIGGVVNAVNLRNGRVAFFANEQVVETVTARLSITGAELITEDDLTTIRNYIVGNIMRNPDFVFSDQARPDEGVDLLGVIAGLYNILHKLVTGEDYNYMFHWANKVGGWVEDKYFDNILKGD